MNYSSDQLTNSHAAGTALRGSSASASIIRHPTVLWLVGVLILAAGVRLYQLDSPNYWLDEIHSLVASAAHRSEFEALPHGVIVPVAPRFSDITPQTSLSDIWQGMKTDVHPPFYFMLLYLWRQIAPAGEAMMRLPSVLFSVASIWLTAWIFWREGKRHTAILTAGILTFSFAHILMAQNVRAYALGFLLVAASYLLLARGRQLWPMLTRRQRLGYLTAYSLCTYFAVMTHYFAGLAFLGQAVVLLFWKDRQGLGWWIGAASTTALIFAITWGPVLPHQLDFSKSNTWLNATDTNHAWHTILRLTDLPIRLLFVHKEFDLNLLRSMAGLTLTVASLWLALRSGCMSSQLFAAWYLVPILMLTAIDLTAGKELLKHVRYISVGVPGLAGLVALSMKQLPALPRNLFMGGYVLILLVTLRLPTPDNPANRIAATLISQQTTTDTLLVFDAVGWPPFWVSQIYHNVAYYLPEFLEKPLPPVVLLRESPSPALLNKMAKFTRLLVISPRVDTIPNPLPDEYQRVGNVTRAYQIGWIYAFKRIGNAP